MNRRGFIKALACGIAATTLALHIDPQIVSELFGGETACQLLTREYNAFCKRERRRPKEIYLDGQLYDRFSSELIPLQRFVPADLDKGLIGRPCLMFKTTRAWKVSDTGWGYRFV